MASDDSAVRESTLSAVRESTLTRPRPTPGSPLPSPAQRSARVVPARRTRRQRRLLSRHQLQAAIIAVALVIVGTVSGVTIGNHHEPPSLRTIPLNLGKGFGAGTDTLKRSADPRTTKKGSTVASKSTAKPAAVAPVAPLRNRVDPDLLLTSPASLTAAQIAAVTRVTGATRVLQVDSAQVKLGKGITTAIGVDPSTFRQYTPENTAPVDALWQRVASGDAAVAHAVAAALQVKLGGHTRLGRVVQRDVRVGAFATTRLPGVGVVVDRTRSAAYGLVRGAALIMVLPTGADPLVASSAATQVLPKTRVQALRYSVQTGVAGGSPSGPVVPFGIPILGNGWTIPMALGTYTLTQRFGVNGHPGIDLAAPFGTPIYAASEGDVLYWGPAQGFGNWIVLQHPGGIQTVYGHMRSDELIIGPVAHVKAGQLIARVGSEGNSTGPHLHFEVHVDNVRTDPIAFLNAHGVSQNPVAPHPGLAGWIAMSAVASRSSGPTLSARARLALALERAASATSRRLGRGSGEMIGGKVALRAHPKVMVEVAAGRALACVSGTNGKTTTTRLLAAALATAGPVASNSGGANMGPGVLHALARKPYGSAGALEVDEIWLPRVAREVRPRACVLLNVTRDQLDRSNETRRIAGMWRTLGGELDGCTAVANCDDPLVTYAAQGFDAQVWVAAGQNWTADAMVCPACGRLIERGPEFGWRCGSCELHRPEPEIVVLAADRLLWRGRELAVHLVLPGRVNTGNAAHAAAAAELLGVRPEDALAAMTAVDAVQGRYSETQLAPGRRGRLLLAKNPAGWVEMLELLETEPDRPVIIDFNSRTADGRDPSWLWDVPFERLSGRQVLVTGERREDVGVRLAYAEVAHTLHDSAEAAAAAAPPGPLDVVANYTAFRDLLVRSGQRSVEPAVKPAVQEPAP